MCNSVRLGDICTKITDGSHNPPQGISCSDYLMLSSKNIYDDDISFDDPRYLSKENYETENKRTQISVGDILLTIVGTIGRVAVVSKTEKKICLQRSVAVIKPKQELIDSRFLMYQLQSMRTHLEQEARGVAQKGIYLKQVENLQIKVPSRDEQLQAVSNLDQISELISLRKQQLAKLDELVKARFVELFENSNYPTEPLNNNVIEMFIGPFGSSLKNEVFVDKENGFCMVYEQKHAIQKTMDVPTRYVPKSKYEELKRFTILGGDIIVSCRGTIGEIYTVPDDAPMGIMHPSIMKIRLNTEKYNQKFFVFALEQYMDEHNAEAKGSGVKMAVSATVLGQADFVIPPLEVQNHFTTFVEQTDKSKLAIQKSLDELETLKKALMQKYFG